MFYHFRQNNSGGSWTYDPKTGISCHVIVEAADAAEANRRAEWVGIYFDGCNSGTDCSCCGDRWSQVDESDASLTPSVYGYEVHPNDLYPAKDDPSQAGFFRWLREGDAEGFIHYADGRFSPFWETTAERQDLDGSYGYGVNFGSRWDVPFVFMVTSTGWDEEGNHSVPTKGAKSRRSWGLAEWVKPDKSTVVIDKEYGYLEAWFPTEAEARAFAAELVATKRTFADMVNEGVAELKASKLASKELKKALAIWKQ